MTARRAAAGLCVAALLFLAALALNSIYEGSRLLALLAGAVAIPVALSLALRRAPSWLVAPVSVAGLAAYTLNAVRVTADGADVMGATRDALLGQIPRLLTAMIPVEPAPDTVVLPVVAVWAAALVGGELAIRAGRVLAAFAAPAAVYAGALIVVGPNAGTPLWQPSAFVGIAAVGLAVSARPQSEARRFWPVPGGQRLRTSGSAGGARTVAAGVLAVAVLAGAGVALAPVVAAKVTAQPADPRKYVERPELDTIDDNPLIRLSGWAQNPTQRLFDVELTAPAASGRAARAPERIRLAVLNDYDGITWRVGATYRAAGRVLPPPVVLAPRTVAVTQRVTVRDLGGRLLPAVDAARRVDGVRIAYDEASGTLLQPDGLRPGATYEVRSERPQPDVNLLTSAAVPAGSAVARFLALGDARPPKQLDDIATYVKGQAASPFARATALETFLAEHYTYAADAPSGHSYPNLTFFLSAPKPEGGQRGTSEQFAASFAVIARLMGLPSRIAVGFRPPGGAGAQPVLAGSAFAWPEIYFDGIGWYAFNPLPQVNSTARPPEEEFKPDPSPSKQPETNDPIQGKGAGQPKASASARPRAVAPAGGSSAGPLLGGFAALAVALVLAVPPVLRRRRRRSRLFSGSPSARVGGAWLEVLDALRQAGRRPAAHLPVADVAALATVALPGHGPLPPLDGLATLVNFAGFAPFAASDADAEAAATSAEAYIVALRAQRPWWRRAQWTLSPRPLFWRASRGPASSGGTAQAGGPPVRDDEDGLGGAPANRLVHTRSDSAST